MTVSVDDNNENVISFSSRSPLTPFAPVWKYFIGEQQLTDIDIDSLRDFIISKESEVLSIKDVPINDAGTGVGHDSTTGRFLYYNIFDWDHSEIKKLQRGIKILYHKYYGNLVQTDGIPHVKIKGWMNILKKGQHIDKHLHGYDNTSFLSGNFVVAAEDTKTVYVNPYELSSIDELLERIDSGETSEGGNLYASTNKPGLLTLFPSYIPHFTSVHMGDKPRITLAFEVTPFENKI
jgi:hypothetical protein